MTNRTRIFGHLMVMLLITAATTRAAESIVSAVPADGGFALVGPDGPAPIWFDAGDATVVSIAAHDFAADVERVTGRKPTVNSDTETLFGSAVLQPAPPGPAEPTRGLKHRTTDAVVLIGTLGHSRLIDALAKSGRLDTAQLDGKWETFVIITVEHPLAGVDRALVIAGSDRRGTAFGVYELSQQIGVSPWYWWADVPPKKKSEVYVRAGVTLMGPPSVKYRGIFINDEDWGLQPWAAQTFAPEEGGIGPKVYRKVFELLLRLKANTLWPAMHACTRPFNAFPENKQLADDYGIVMGSSHAEPMLRNNVGEWTAPHEDYNYVTNREGVLKYWEERVAANGRFENIFTVGMRGIHDSAIQGTKTDEERIRVLERVFADQRALLAKHVNPDVEQVPQMFCAYKEVLDLYRQGLQVPDDVTIVWPDDNFGYIRNFATPEEQRTRTGGFGVYYHISYLGRPMAYLWLCTTPPALIWEEMSKAYDHGARQIWIVNVGDIKPAEIDTEFFLRMAWDINRWNRETLPHFLEEWATREFGAEHAAEIAAIMRDYYQLNYQRKPEHLQWWLPREEPRPSPLSWSDYGDEVSLRLNQWSELNRRMTEQSLEMRSNGDAWFELVGYPIRASYLANARYFWPEMAERLEAQGRRSEAWPLVLWAENLDWQLADPLRAEYEQEKWRGFMRVEPADEQWASMRVAPWKAPVLVGGGTPSDDLLLIPEGGRIPNENLSLPTVDPFTGSSKFVDCIGYGLDLLVRADSPWLRVDGRQWLHPEKSRILVTVDWSRAPRGVDVLGEISFELSNHRRTITVPIFNPESPRPDELAGWFVQSNGVVSMEAENFTRKLDGVASSWEVVAGLGRTGSGSIFVFPVSAGRVDASTALVTAPCVEYDTYFFTLGEHRLTANLIPTHPLIAGRGLRFAAGLDEQPPQIVVVPREVGDAAWSQGVLNNTVTGSTSINVPSAGKHVLKVYMVDAGVVLDKIVIDCGGLKPSYLGPPETRVPAGKN